MVGSAFRLADANVDFHTTWETLEEILATQRSPLRAGPDETADTALWRCLNRAVDLGPAKRIGGDTKTQSYGYGLLGR
jgi:hypothetical protein